MSEKEGTFVKFKLYDFVVDETEIEKSPAPKPKSPSKQPLVHSSTKPELKSSIEYFSNILDLKPKPIESQT